MTGAAEGQAELPIAYVHGFCLHPLLQPIAALEQCLAARHIRLARRAGEPALRLLQNDDR
jgi:hypothetical protein